MAIPVIQNSYSAGELSPEIFGRTDLEKYKKGASTMRNCFASYRGGAYSRAGTKFVGQSKQGEFGAAFSASSPQLIPFQFSVDQGIVIEAGEKYFRFIQNGSQITESPISITAITNTDPVHISVSQSWSVSDSVFISGATGLTRLNGNVYAVVTTTSQSVTLQSMLTGALIDTTTSGTYISGGTAARIYTVTTPYSAVDLPYLKWNESADVMTFTCVNQQTGTEYPPYDLSRISSSHWTMTRTMFAASISAPISVSGSATVTTASNPTDYNYVVTAIDALTSQESVASHIIDVSGSVDIAQTAGSINLSWSPVTGASQYNLYRAPPAYASTVPVGSLFSYVGTSLGLAFNDTNITPDATKAPPLHENPFATSSILAISFSSFGSAISTATVTVSSVNGTGFVGTPVVIGGQIQWVVVQNGGEGYTSGDHVNIAATYTTTSSTSAVAILTIGPSTGTWPGVSCYFQERRFYANTKNQPDTYFGSQPGAFTNFDVSNPVQDDDAITGTPWAQQVNGIQSMVPMPNGLVILTGLGAWQLSGGAAQTAVTPADQTAIPQAYNGCSPVIRPITINYDILYVQEKGSIVRDLAYNFFVNIYTGTDLTVLSNHLFDGYQILRWDWAEEPFKLIWVVRSDGTLLCLTYLKEQDVYAWSRHDTNGLFQSVAVVSEPPVNAPYFVVKRLIQGDSGTTPVWAYYIERMDNRLWQDAAHTWCVDSGLNYPQNFPSAILSAASATGVATLQQPTVAWGGANYSLSTYATVNDPAGSGAVVTLTIVAGVITAAVVGGTLTGYTNPSVSVTDPTGAGAGAVININSLRLTTFTASLPVFSNVAGSGAAGDVINFSALATGSTVDNHPGGGIATVVTFNSSTSLDVSITQPITATIPNDPYNTPIPQPAGSWSIINPTMTVNGLDHLEGMTVACLADGYVQEPMTVVDGAITLQSPASTIVVGLPFIAQVQTMYMDAPDQVTTQTRRKNVQNVTARVFKTRGIQVGVNQPDASVQPNGAVLPWTGMRDIAPGWNVAIPNNPPALFTGDYPLNSVYGQQSPRGQIAFQQLNPLPMNVTAEVAWVTVGDDVSKD